MKATLIIVCFCTQLFSSVQAQKTNQHKYNFIVVPSFHLLNGDAATSTSLQLNIGIANKKNHITVGTGIDYYKFRTVPLLLDFKHFFGKKQNKVFAYTSLGFAVPWLLEEQKRMYWTNWGGINSLADYTSGLQYKFGIGYALTNKKNKSVLINLGFNSKKINEEIQQMVFNGTTTTLMPFTTSYQLNRIAIGIGYTL